MEENILYSEMNVLDEDMLQIKYGDIILDFGYYEGLRAYKIFIIKNNNWDNPINQITFTNMNDIPDMLQVYKKKCYDGDYI